MVYTYFMMTLLLLSITITVVAELKQIDLIIHQKYLDPDCSGTTYPALVINNQFPAPTIRVSKNDEVEIRVFNLADMPSSIHFHGIRQIGSVESDGVPTVTQNAIDPGYSFTHRFQLKDQAGTFFYHAHVGVQDDTVQGAFIVENHDNGNIATELTLQGDASNDDVDENNCDYDDNDTYDCDFNDEDNNNDTGYDYDDTEENLIYELLNYIDDSPVEEVDQRQYQYQDGPYGYDDELILHLSEWWHQPFLEREEYYLGTNYSHDPNADSVLFNGRTLYQPHSSATQPHCEGHTIFDVLPDRTYRLRVIGGNTFRTYGLGIKNHNMTIIEVDGELVHPYTTTHLEVTPGQRFSVLIHTDKFKLRPEGKNENGYATINNNMFTIATSYRHRHRATGHTENGFGFLRYVDPSYKLNKRDKMPPIRKKRTISHKGGKNNHGLSPAHQNPKEKSLENHAHSPKNDVSRTNETSPHEHKDKKPKIIHENFPDIPDIVPRDWIWPYLRPLEPPPRWLYQTPDRTLKIRSWTTDMPDGSTRYLVNGKLLHAHKTTHMYDISETTKFEANNIPNHFTLLKLQSTFTERTVAEMQLDDDGFEPTLGTYPIQLNETVDIVLQNVKAGRNCLLHPWHTHGHSHYVIASGDGEYIHERDHHIRNFPNPIYKDVSVVYETKVDPHTNGCGWTKIRLYADNPGVWIIHCHITSHMLQGKMFLLEEAPEWIDKFRRYK